jgi:ATP-dependent RNA helicase DeaD
MKFNELNLESEILKAIERFGFTEPTKIQEKSIPVLLEGRDIVGQSQTGSGKTLAFGIPITQKVKAGRGIQCVVLTPTRELAQQINDVLISLTSFKRLKIAVVYGGVGMEPQYHALKTADIVVATPGRFLDHMRRQTIILDKVSMLVIDEADKLFEMGFIDDVNMIIDHLPRQRQTMLFSATMYGDVKKLVEKHLNEPVNVKDQAHVDKTLLKHQYYQVSIHEKFSLLVHLLKNKTPGLAIVFCGTRHEVDIIEENLKTQGINAMAVHGGLSQNKRTNAVDSLKSQDIQVLVATDVAARGLDFSNISHVYNYDSAKSPSEYTHRTGRTARAGKSGEAVTLLTERDYDNFNSVLSDHELQIERVDVPEFKKVYFKRPQRSEGPHRPHMHPRPGFQSRSYSQRRSR